jgi:predicted unusual protein kinase regulating ubiquinone biosynthesis (AarF/ABC1/UbiB family)
MIETSPNSAAVFDRYGLRAAGRLWGGAPVPDDESAAEDIGKRLREAFEQLGGLYAAFGRFLGWRADLLDSSFIGNLRHLRLNLPVVPVSTVQRIIRRELGAAAVELADHLEDSPVWNTLSRTAYVSRYRDQPVIVQVARDPVSEESLAAFEKGLRALSRPEVAGMVTPAVLSQFREWIRNSESLTRERSLLDALGNYAGETLAEYPRVIPELTTSSILCWPDVPGRPVSELIARGDTQTVVLIASAILEQLYSLSIVAADLDLDAMFVGPNNRLHFRWLSGALSVLPN